MENKKEREQPETQNVIVTEVKSEEKFDIKENLGEENSSVDSVASFDDGSLGKFKDAKSLLDAYNNLQAEFTRKCQKLSELENEKKIFENASLTEQNKNEIIESYLENVKRNNAPKVISSFVGSGITLDAPPKPQNLEEAKELISKMFN